MGPTIDTSQLVYYSAGLVNLTSAIVLGATAAFGTQRATLATYAAGLACTGAGFVLVALASNVDRSLVSSAHLLLVCGLLALWHAVLRLFGRPTGTPIFVATAVFAAAVLGVLAQHERWDRLRELVVMTTAIASMLGRA